MADLQQLEEQIVGLSLLDAAQLVKKLEERLGVSAAGSGPGMMAWGRGGARRGPGGRKTEVSVSFREVVAHKIKITYRFPLHRGYSDSPLQRPREAESGRL